jgi:integrase
MSIFVGWGTAERGMMLTDTGIKKAKPREKGYRLPGGQADRGLFVWVTPSGGRLFRWKFRHGRKEKIISYGQYPDVSLATARELHAEARKLHAAGVDPMAKRKQDKAARKSSALNSFETIARLWLEHWQENKSRQHVDATRRRMEANILPRLGGRPIAEIQPSELVAMVKAIEMRGAGDLAKRALETTGQIFRHAIAHGLGKVTLNPAEQFKPRDVLKPTTKTNLARIDAKELPGLLRAIELYRGKVITRLAMKLMAMAFVRTSELIGARWDEFDLEEKRWKIPMERMKMPSPHIVPLASQAIEVLELLRTLTGKGALVFPGERDQGKPMSNNTILLALKRMGYKGQMTGHGFRGVASTILHEQGFEHAHIELQLAHSKRNSVSASYDHALYLEPRAKMMQAWADFLEQTQRQGKVLPFRRNVA